MARALQRKIDLPKGVVPDPVKLHRPVKADPVDIDALPPAFRRGEVEVTNDDPEDVTTAQPGTQAEPEPPAPAKRKRVLRSVKIDVRTDDRLAEVPDRDIYDTYVGRDFDSMTYVQVFDYCRTEHVNLLVQGPTGSGKTHAVMAYAALRGLPYYSVSSSVGVEASQLFGKFIPDANGKGYVWQDGPVTDLARYGGVLLINEINFIPERISTVLFSLLDRRREIQLVDHQGEVIRAHDQLLIVADMNPHYEGTRPLNRALRNRFGVQLDWGYDADVERKLVGNDMLVHLATRIRSEPNTAGLMTPVSTNMLLEFDRIVRSTGNLNFAVTNFLTHWDSGDRQFVDVVLKPMIGNIAAAYEKEGVELR
jgi:hypothetical protein